MGYDAIEIPLQSFRGYNSEINVYLTPERPNDYGENSGASIFLISGDGMYLQSIDEEGLPGVKYSKSVNQR
jgi:hypothetical protein